MNNDTDKPDDTEHKSRQDEERYREAKKQDWQRYDAEYDRATGIPKFGPL